MSFMKGCLVCFNTVEYNLEQFVCLLGLDHPTTVGGGERKTKKKKKNAAFSQQKDQQIGKRCSAYLIFFLFLPPTSFNRFYQVFMINLRHKAPTSDSPSLVLSLCLFSYV